MIYHEKTEWCDIYISEACEESKPRVLLIGDSITRSYYNYVQQRVAEHYVCARVTSSKSVVHPMFFKELALVLEDYDVSVIHFNNGLHGWKYSEAVYETGLAKTFDILLSHCKASHVIWASSTPVWKNDESGTLDVKTERVRERNKLAAAIAVDRGVRINDLFSTVIDRPELVSKDGVHFVEAGQIVLGERVVRALAETEHSMPESCE